MIARFSLYGFLKNQRYFEPFLVLAFLEKGLSFFQIGILIAFREACVNLMEIPTGTLADLYGRRRSMMLSFGAYIASFAIFGASGVYWQFFPAMFLFAVGDAFRTGTHKAMIFTWLRLRGRISEKTKVYGYTRSWSQIGSAVSVVLAAALVLVVRNYTAIFYFSIIPYVLALVNFLGYPRELDGAPTTNVSFRHVLRHLWETLLSSIRMRPLRRLMLESMGFEGMFKAAKDYLQPILQATALALPICVSLGDKQRSAVLVGVVYFVLYIGSAFASRMSHRLARRTASEERAARVLWGVAFLLYAALVPLLYVEAHMLVIVGFAALFLLQNVWRPILISRFDEYATETQGATVLSIESQAKSIATMLIAPTLGWAVDCLLRLQASGSHPQGVFWPVGLLGAALAGLALLKKRQGAPEPHEGQEAG